MMMPLQKKAYKPFADWVANNLPEIDRNDKVWNAFMKHGQFGDPETARAILKDDVPPIIFVEKIAWLGKFSPQKPKIISISSALVDDFCQNSTDQAKRQRIEATVLHEFVHWALFNADKPERPDEEKGVEFEQEAYGSVTVGETEEPKPVLVNRLTDDTLGELSRRWESRGDPGAIARDTNGGWSYGLYQLSSRQGSVRPFLTFLKTRGAAVPRYAEFAEALEDAGGEPAALAGTDGFKSAWKKLALDPLFRTAQHEYIKSAFYGQYVSNLARIGISLADRSHALRDVAWSVSVQHGPGAVSLFKRPWDALGEPARRDDALYINAIYDERSRVDVYFQKSSPDERTAVLNRFKDERRAALALLGNAVA